MIILGGGIQMKITQIQIKGLHGEYEYNVKFDEKLTFLYGANGCGKTTVLNILASIITGKLYNLLEYDFEEIVLSYKKDEKRSNIRNIKIQKNSDEEMYFVYFEEEEFVIQNLNSLKERLYRKAEDDNIDKLFSERYPFVNRIKDTFNYVYLPLNRYGMNIHDERDYYYRRNHYIRYHNNPYNTYLNDSLNYVSELIRDNCARINYAENRINDKFKQDVLTSSVGISSDMQLNKILTDITTVTWGAILKTKETYIKTLKDIGILNDAITKRVEKYFSDFEEEYNRHDKNENGISVNLVWKYSEYLKIKEISQLAKENELKKEKVRQSQEMFLEVIKRFFASNGKVVKISTEGQIYFETLNKKKDKKIYLSDLSSGEKQIVIIFASLIFGLEDQKTGIYIVDEPEASLHLLWQSQFVSSILNTNRNIQLIFATHSPELIADYREYAVELKNRGKTNDK